MLNPHLAESSILVSFVKLYKSKEFNVSWPKFEPVFAFSYNVYVPAPAPAFPWEAAP